MEAVLDALTAAKLRLDNAETLGDEITAFSDWCKLFDEKERLEGLAVEDAKGYEL